MAKSIFEYDDYKPYVLDRIQSSPGGGRGIRRRLAEHMGCQVAYVSHVLAAERHFSLEQAEALTRFFSLREDECDYFLLLVEYQRAGTPDLKKHLLKQINKLRLRYQEIKGRLRIDREIDEEDQMRYYSSWHFQAIHTILTIPELRTAVKIAERLHLSPERVNEVLTFLLERGMVREERGAYTPTEVQIHLPRTSPMISKLHTNWRIQSLKRLDDMAAEDYHYSGVVTLSRADALKVKEILMNALTSAIAVVRDSKEEQISVLSMDFYEV